MAPDRHQSGRRSSAASAGKAKAPPGRGCGPRPAECLAGGLGFEPRLAESESAVLPLDDPPAAGGRVSTPAIRSCKDLREGTAAMPAADATLRPFPLSPWLRYS